MFQLALLTLAVTAGIYSKAALTPLQETMQTALALSDNQIALIQGAALALPMLVIGIPLGLVVDRHSRVRLLLVSTVLLLTGSVLTAFASSFYALFAARSLVGLALLAMNPIAFSLRADLFGPAQRGRAGMVMWIAQMAGMSAAFAIGGELIAAFGSEPNAWRRALLWMTAPLLLGVVILTLLMREPPRSGRIVLRPSVRGSFLQFWTYRAVILPVMSGRIFAIMAIGSMMIWTAPVLARVFALPPDRIGAIMAIAAPLGTIGGIVLGSFLADRCQQQGGPYKTISVASAMALLCTPLSPFSVMPGVVSAGVFLVMSMAMLSAICAMTSTLVSNVIPNEIRGLYGGVSDGITSFLSVTFGPLLVSVLSGVIGGATAMGQALALVCVGASLLCAAVFGFGRRYFRSAAVP